MTVATGYAPNGASANTDPGADSPAPAGPRRRPRTTLPRRRRTRLSQDPVQSLEERMTAARRKVFPVFTHIGDACRAAGFLPSPCLSVRNSIATVDSEPARARTFATGCYVGRSDLPHVWRYPWVFAAQVEAAGYEILRFEAPSIPVPYLASVLPCALGMQFADRPSEKGALLSLFGLRQHRRRPQASVGESMMRRPLECGSADRLRTVTMSPLLLLLWGVALLFVPGYLIAFLFSPNLEEARGRGEIVAFAIAWGAGWLTLLGIVLHVLNLLSAGGLIGSWASRSSSSPSHKPPLTSPTTRRQRFSGTPIVTRAFSSTATSIPCGPRRREHPCRTSSSPSTSAHPSTSGRFRMRSRHSLGTLMPRDFEIQVGNSAGGPFTTVHTINDFVATASPAMWFEFTFAAPMVGFHVRLHINETNAFSDGNFYVQINEVEVLGAFPQPDRANLSWTATCDNASVGTAASFDNRFSTSPITGEPTFQAATPVVGEPTPGPAAQLGRNRTCGINHVLLRR